MMRAINRLLEQVVREHPDQWLWFHDRWRYARRKGLL
jgi:KDO2-lipid IV(A) lauroyltransferase